MGLKRIYQHPNELEGWCLRQSWSADHGLSGGEEFDCKLIH